MKIKNIILIKCKDNYNLHCLIIVLMIIKDSLILILKIIISITISKINNKSKIKIVYIKKNDKLN